MTAGDWVIDFEVAVLEALAGRRRFPVTFVPRVVPTRGEVSEAAARIAQLDRMLEVEYLVASDEGSIPACLVVRASEFDPEPPPLLEGHPMPRDRMVG